MDRHPDLPELSAYSAAVVTSSDRAHDGTYEDKSGPAAVSWLTQHGVKEPSKLVVPDERSALLESILGFVKDGIELLVISGGTGLGPRDITPQVVDSLADYAVPGMGEMLRAGSLKYSLNAYLSRGGGWVKDRTLILALPGNPKAVTEQLDIISDILPQALKALKGKCDHRRRVDSHD